MADISKCTGKGCRKRRTCYRFIAPASDWQWTREPPKGEKCERYWKVTKGDK